MATPLGQEEIKVFLDIDESQIKDFRDYVLDLFTSSTVKGFEAAVAQVAKQFGSSAKEVRELEGALRDVRELLEAEVAAGNDSLKNRQAIVALRKAESDALSRTVKLQKQAQKEQVKREGGIRRLAETEERIAREQRDRELNYQRDLQRRRALVEAMRRDRLKNGSVLRAQLDAERQITREVEKQERIVKRAATTAPKVRSGAMPRTTLHSQNVLRIIQDLPYGMFGIANNIEQLGESSSRLFATFRNEGLSSTQALGAALRATFMPLVAGPMAFATLVTGAVALAQNWDRITAAVKSLQERLSGLTKAQIAYNRAIEELRAKQPEEVFGKIGNLSDAMKVGLDIERELQRRREELERIPMETRTIDLGGGRSREITVSSDPKRSAQLKREIEFYEKQQVFLAERTAQLQNQQEIESKVAALNIGARDLDVLEERLRLREAEINLIDDPNQRKARMEELEVERKKLKLRRELLEVEKEIRDIQGATGMNPDIAQGSQSRFNLLQLRKRAIEAQLASIRPEGTKISDANLRFNLPGSDEGIETYDPMLDVAYSILDQAKHRVREDQRRIQNTERLLNQNTRTGFRIAALGISGITDPFERDRAAVALQQRQSLTGIAEERARILGQMGVSSMDEALSITDPTNDEQAAQLERLRLLKEEEVAVYDETARRIAEIERAKRDTILGYQQEITSTMSDMAGSLATIMGEVSDKGFEQNKAMLYTQAVMDAISAEIAVVRSILATPSPGPWKIAAAFASGAAVLLKLMAQAKQIKNMKKGGSSKAPSGGYVKLNSAVNSERAFNFARQRQEGRRAQSDAQVQEMVGMREDLKKLTGTLTDLKVTIDDPTMADVYRIGKKRVQKFDGSA